MVLCKGNIDTETKAFMRVCGVMPHVVLYTYLLVFEILRSLIHDLCVFPFVFLLHDEKHDSASDFLIT